MAMACAASAHAGDWRFDPSVGASATYTDNVKQSAANEESALILSATPGFTLRSEGSRRVQATLQYGLSAATRFGDDDNSDDLNHNLNAVGKAELVEDFLFIDGNAHVSQELISLLDSPAGADINSSNRATVGTYSVSPYIQKRLGNFANTLVRYTASGAIFENDVATQSASNSLTAELNSGPRFNDLSWGLNYSIRKTQNDNAVDTTFERAVAQLGYELTRKFRVFGTVGHDWNDYPSSTATGGASYSLGFGWSPSRRTSIEASAGERYFGRTYSLQARHRTRATNWSVGYTEDAEDLGNFVPSRGTVYDYLCPDSSGNLVLVTDWPFNFPPAQGCARFGGKSGLVFDLRDGVFISKALRAGVSWIVGRITYSLNLSDSKRLYTLQNAEDRTQSLGVSAAYQMTPHTTVNGSVTLAQNQVPAALALTARDDDLTTLVLGVNHRFSDRVNGALTFRHSQRDSNAASSGYEENNLTASVHMGF